MNLNAAVMDIERVSGCMVVVDMARPEDRRVAGSIPEYTDFLTNSSEQVTY